MEYYMKRLFLCFILITSAFLFVAGNAWCLPIIDNISTSTSEAYISGYLGVGDEYYIDRNYTIVSQPSGFETYEAILTANDDKFVAAANHLSFDVTTDVTLWVAYDQRATSLPSWLGSNFTLWDGVDLIVRTTDSNMDYFKLYYADFGMGNVILGGNYASGASGAESNYIVYAQRVPEPASMLLLGCGLLGLVGIGRKKIFKK
jgi:hypothetical protein